MPSALTYVGSNISPVDATSGYRIPFDTVANDSGGFYDSGSPTKFTVPAGVDAVVLTATAAVNGLTTGGSLAGSILRNGTLDQTLPSEWCVSDVNGIARVCLASGVIPVAEGDEFEVYITVLGSPPDTSVSIKNVSNFGIWDATAQL